ncbi:hypothetical protein ABMX48_00015 [Streptomyces cavourensis]
MGTLSARRAGSGMPTSPESISTARLQGDAPATAEVVAVGLGDLFSDGVRGMQVDRGPGRPCGHPASAQAAEAAVAQAEELLTGG